MADSESGAVVIQSIKVSSTRTVLNVVYYEIETIFTSGRRSVVLSRFREFDELNKRIRADYKLKFKHLCNNLPEFPAKSAIPFLEKQNDEFINQRKEQLQTYLQKLAKLPHAQENKDFIDFLNRSVGDGNEYEKVYKLNPEKKESDSKNAAPDFSAPASAAASASSPTSSSASSSTSSASATVSVGATTSSTGTVFLSRGFSAGTHPETKTAAAKSTSSRPAAPKTAPPSEPAKAESKEEQKATEPASPKEAGKYKAAEPPKPPQDTSVLGTLKTGFSNLGGLFSKKSAKPNVEEGVKNENL